MHWVEEVAMIVHQEVISNDVVVETKSVDKVYGF
jgi:hypothetical protein